MKNNSFSFDIKNYQKKYESASLLDDFKFRELAKDKLAIQEILRVILNDEKLQVLESIEQSEESVPMIHGVRLDCKTKLSTGEIVNIEVQNINNDNMFYRMRYYSSMLTIENSPKSKNFLYEKIPKLIMIMFCNFNICNNDKVINEIVNLVKDTKQEIDDGIRKIFVSVENKTNDEVLKALLKIISTNDYIDKSKFPELSNSKIKINKNEVGGADNMSGLALEIYNDGVEAGITQGEEQGIAKGLEQGEVKGSINMLVELVKDGKIDVSYAIKKLGITKEQFNEYLKQ
jgi:predicted transposase/invertase (TIGR01784 family)